MLTLLTLLSMAVALAAFFAVMLWLDPKRRQYAAATAVAVGAVGLADTAPTVGGAALAQDDPPEIIVHGDLPSNCERRDSGDIFCDGMTLLDWCTSLGSASQSENLCLGATAAAVLAAAPAAVAVRAAVAATLRHTYRLGRTVLAATQPGKTATAARHTAQPSAATGSVHTLPPAR